jgi:hypothetical protein
MAEKKLQDIDEVVELMKKDAELDRLKDEISLKKAKLDQNRYTQQLEELEQNQKDLAIAKNLDFSCMSLEQQESTLKEFDDYFAAAKKKMIFINQTFSEFVPFFRKNLLLLGASTGKGKSTAAANIAFSLLRQRNPETGKLYRCMVITNEERAEDVYNRVTFLGRGWHYVNHDEFTPEQISVCRQAIPALANGGRLMVVDNTYGGAHGITTSIEGIESIFENMIAKGDFYDCIIIDYYQNIINSKKNPYLDEFKVQAKLARMLDQYKNIYPAPIVLLAQVNPLTDEDDHTPFNRRIAGRKLIMDVCTFAAEMSIDYARRATQFVFWKSRFTKAVGQSLLAGYDKGKLVPYTKEFETSVRDENDKKAKDMIDRNANKVLDIANGIPDAFKKEDKNEPRE